MSDAAIIAIITGSVTVIGTLLNTALTIWLKAKVNTVNLKVKENSDELKVVHNEVNHKMDELIQVTKDASHAEGKLEAMNERDKNQTKKK